MIDLRQMAQGVIPVKSDTGVEVITVKPQTELMQVGAPANFATINMQSLQRGNDNIFQGTLKNESEATRDLVIGGLASGKGDYQAFNLQPSAVDFATVIELTSAVPANTGKFQALNKRLSVMPAIFSMITMQTNVPAQSNVNLITGFITKSLTPQENTIFSPVCDACQNNSITVFTKEFKGAFFAGLNNYIKIPLVRMIGVGEFVTLRFEYAGEHQAASLSPQGQGLI